jgi:hypothetical protein
MVSPPSANRALPSRVCLLAALPVTWAVFTAWEGNLTGREGMLLVLWVALLSGLCCLQLVIAVNEREAWGPRVARTIPRRWWLRLPAFLLYSGSAGGVLFAFLLFGLTWLGAQGALALTAARHAASVFPAGPFMTTPREMLSIAFAVVGIVGLYVYGYALTAVFLRNQSGRRLRIVDTWILMIFLVAVSCAGPLVVSYVLSGRHWRYDEQVYWLLNNPIAGAIAAGNRFDPHRSLFFVVAGGWAVFVTLLNAPWFIRQCRRFRPYSGGDRPPVPAPVVADAPDLDATQTAP